MLVRLELNFKLNKLLIIDKLDIRNNFTCKKYLIIFWNNSEKINQINCNSIIDIVEKNADLFKSIYLDWINQIGEIKINSIPLYEKLKIRNSCSYWWQVHL